MDALRASRSTRGRYLSWRLYILCHLSKSGVLKVQLSIVSKRLVDNLSPIVVFILPSWSKRTFVKSLQFLSWTL